MRLDDYCEVFERMQFPTVGAREHPAREAVIEARHALAPAVLDDEFLADCVDLELDRLERSEQRIGLTAFYTIDGPGVRFAFGYWPPGATAGPHEHTAWTITAVCRNELEVFTFDRDASYRRGELVSKNRFEASAGRTGFIYEPCIHEPRNPTDTVSLSLHVLSPRDGERLEDYDRCIAGLAPPPDDARDTHPYGAVAAMRRRHRLVGILAHTLGTMHVPHAQGLRVRCAELGSATTRRRIVGAQRPSRWMLAHAHPDLALDARVVDGGVELYAQSRAGMVHELTMNLPARAAVAFAARESVFDVQALPGDLTDDERTAIAEALEDTGLFRRIP